MKGSIFTTFQQFVEQKFGADTWENLLESANLESSGAYTSLGNYKDKELVELLGILCTEMKLDLKVALKDFGEFLFPVLQASQPKFTQRIKFIPFLKSIENTIHVEVKKIYPDAVLPTFDYKEDKEKKITLIYHSERKLCYLAEGLVLGAANFFSEKVDIQHPVCMHNGDKKCHLIVEIQS